jgi:hypothetical protein
MKKINWLYVGIGAVVLYFVWKKFMNTGGSTSGDILGASVEAEDMVNPVVMKSDVSQGDMVNNLAFASGGTRIPNQQVSCFCNGAYHGVISHRKCANLCKPARKRH